MKMDQNKTKYFSPPQIIPHNYKKSKLARASDCQTLNVISAFGHLYNYCHFFISIALKESVKFSEDTNLKTSP